MIPLRDNIPYRTVPVVNYAFIATCTVVFLLQLSTSPEEPSVVERYGMIPARISNPGEPVEIKDVQLVRTNQGLAKRVITREAAPSAVPPLWTMLTCIFLHGGWMHFLGNMWFLHIFGDNVEDRFGHFGYALFYLASGVAASLAHFVTDMNSPVPTIGASGAIAGVMGAYFVSYPKAKVVTLLPLFIIWQILVLPAAVFLGIWFVIQFFQGTLSASATGVAWWAHIGGFVAGGGTAWILGKAGVLRPANPAILPRTDHVRAYRVPPGERSW
jgi:membrane associated rhomboid family serine protease